MRTQAAHALILPPLRNNNELEIFGDTRCRLHLRVTIVHPKDDNDVITFRLKRPIASQEVFLRQEMKS
jgi:hypothetical protein